MSKTPPVCDYEGSDYRTRFWENQGRDYEDQVERVALRRLMLSSGDTLIDLGAGFGRLADEYAGYQRVVLFDYSSSLLREAQERLGDDPRFIYVAGDWYKMPFVAGLFDAMVQVRTIHHAADVPALFTQLARIAKPRGQYILEFANKRNIKAIGRRLLGRQAWSPFDREPIEFVELNFNFHPRYIEEQLAAHGFRHVRKLSVSHYRFGPFKKLFPTNFLVWMDSWAQWSGNWWQLTPSVFTQNFASEQGTAAQPGHFFACPSCQTPLPQAAHIKDGPIDCSGCDARWQVDNGLYLFK